MKANREFRSPNYDPVQIPVEFHVLHYTAENLDSTLEIFIDPSRKVSSHLVIDQNGQVYELVECLEGSTQRACMLARAIGLKITPNGKVSTTFRLPSGMHASIS